MLHLLVLAIIVGIALCHYFKPRKGLPPRVGPGILTTMRKMTVTSDLTTLEFLHDLSLLLTGAGKGTTNGAVFRINLPLLTPFIVSSDYKLVRLVMEGSTKDKLPTSEKPSLVRAIDYTSSASILTYV
jgi:hypothetical protein